MNISKFCFDERSQAASKRAIGFIDVNYEAAMNLQLTEEASLFLFSHEVLLMPVDRGQDPDASLSHLNISIYVYVQSQAIVRTIEFRSSQNFLSNERLYQWELL